MGCSPRPQSLSVVQIQGTTAKRQPASESPPLAASAKRAPLNAAPKKRVDFHCADCGATRTAYPNFRHKCEPGPVGYQETRLSICGRCEIADGNVCPLVRDPAKDRPGLIDVGVKMPDVACPAGKWNRVRWNCDKCGSSCFDENGLNRCPVCHPAAKRLPGMVNVPQFRDTPADPKSPLAVVSIAVGQKALDLSKLTWPRMREYAESIGADFVTITDDQFPEYPMGNKFRIGAVSARYDRVAYLDVDIWLRPNVGSLFDQFAPGVVWMHPDIDVMAGPKHEEWLAGETRKLEQEQSITMTESRCRNSGVVIFDRCHAGIWSPPPGRTSTRHVSEQMWVEYQAQQSATIRDLPPEFNCQWYWRDFSKMEKTAKVIHLANCPHGERISRFSRYRNQDRCPQQSSTTCTKPAD